MAPKPDLVAEHAALVRERVELRKLCIDQWLLMTRDLAKQRSDRLWQIEERLKGIERTKQWQRRNA